MGIEKKFDKIALGYRLRRGALELGAGAFAIYAGLTFFGDVLPKNINMLEKEYKTKNIENIALLNDLKNVRNAFFDYGVPIGFIVVGAAGAVSGLSNLTNLTYRKRNY